MGLRDYFRKKDMNERESALLEYISKPTEEHALKVAREFGVEEQFNNLRVGSPYRVPEDLTTLLLQVIPPQRALARVERNLEERVEHTDLAPVKNELGALDYVGAFAKTYGRGFYRGCASAVKGAYIAVKEVAKAVLFPLLPGKVQGWLDESTMKKGGRRAFYNLMSILYDWSAGWAGSAMLLDYYTTLSRDNFILFSFLMSCVPGFSSLLLRLDKFEDNNGEYRFGGGTVGSVYFECPAHLIKSLGSKVSQLNEEARKSLEEKRKALQAPQAINLLPEASERDGHGAA